MSIFSSSLQIRALLIPSRNHHQFHKIPLSPHQLHLLNPLELPSQSSPLRIVKCFSRRQSTAEQEFEFERLFSNLNKATLKRESGSLSGAIFLVAGTTVVVGILAIPAFTQESGVLGFFGCHYSLSGVHGCHWSVHCLSKCQYNV